MQARDLPKNLEDERINAAISELRSSFIEWKNVIEEQQREGLIQFEGPSHEKNFFFPIETLSSLLSSADSKTVDAARLGLYQEAYETIKAAYDHLIQQKPQNDAPISLTAADVNKVIAETSDITAGLVPLYQNELDTKIKKYASQKEQLTKQSSTNKDVMGIGALVTFFVAVGAVVAGPAILAAGAAAVAGVAVCGVGGLAALVTGAAKEYKTRADIDAVEHNREIEESTLKELKENNEKYNAQSHSINAPAATFDHIHTNTLEKSRSQSGSMQHS